MNANTLTHTLTQYLILHTYTNTNTITHTTHTNTSIHTQTHIHTDTHTHSYTNSHPFFRREDSDKVFLHLSPSRIDLQWSRDPILRSTFFTTYYFDNFKLDYDSDNTFAVLSSKEGS